MEYKLFPASVKTIDGTKWGYIDEKGGMIIKPIYDYAMNFQENGLAVVSKDNLSGIIDERGRYVVKLKYNGITPFSEGRATVISKEGSNIIDEKGTELLKRVYPYIGSFRGGRAVVSDNIGEKYEYGYLDRHGKIAIKLKFEAANDFKDREALVQIEEEKFALIDLKGKILRQYDYPFVGAPGDNGFMSFTERIGGPYGYINRDGDVVIRPQYSMALPFEKGRAVVNIAMDYNNMYGVIDKDGSFIIYPKYNYIFFMNEGRIAVGEAIDKERPFFGSVFAIADNDGMMLTNFIYYNLGKFYKGHASASNYKTTFFIGRNGREDNELPVVRGYGMLMIMGTIIRADIDLRTSYLNKYGKFIWRQNVVIPLDHKYKVFEEKFNPNKDYLVYYPRVEGMKNNDSEAKVNIKLKELSEVKEIPEDVQLEYNYTGDFSIEFFKRHLLVLELEAYKFYFGAAHGMPTKIYPHIDLVSGEFYELKDLFKKDSNYVEVISAIIDYQIKNNEEYYYVFPDAFKKISPNQPFYVNEHYLFIYFYPYEIAPYAAGFPTFKIPFLQIKNIIDKHGQFWKAFK